MFYFRWLVATMALVILAVVFGGVKPVSLEMLLNLPGLLVTGAILAFVSLVVSPITRSH